MRPHPVPSQFWIHRITSCILETGNLSNRRNKSMKRKMIGLILMALVVLPIAIAGCDQKANLAASGTQIIEPAKDSREDVLDDLTGNTMPEVSPGSADLITTVQLAEQTRIQAEQIQRDMQWQQLQQSLQQNEQTQRQMDQQIQRDMQWQQLQQSLQQNEQAQRQMEQAQRDAQRLQQQLQSQQLAEQTRRQMEQMQRDLQNSQWIQPPGQPYQPPKVPTVPSYQPPSYTVPYSPPRIPSIPSVPRIP
jgi:hypothetical protein